MILGEIGTFVTLRFSREGDDGEMYSYTVLPQILEGNVTKSVPLTSTWSVS